MRVKDLGRSLSLAIAVNFGGQIHKAVKENSIVFDFDGTLTKKGVYPEIGEPNWPIIEQLQKASKAGFSIIIHTCRLSKRINPEPEVNNQKRQVEEWLRRHDIPYDQIWTSDKPLAMLYVDDRSVDAKNIEEVKAEIRRVIAELD